MLADLLVGANHVGVGTTQRSVNEDFYKGARSTDHDVRVSKLNTKGSQRHRRMRASRKQFSMAHDHDHDNRAVIPLDPFFYSAFDFYSPCSSSLNFLRFTAERCRCFMNLNTGPKDLSGPVLILGLWPCPGPGDPCIFDQPLSCLPASLPEASLAVLPYPMPRGVGAPCANPVLLGAEAHFFCGYFFWSSSTFRPRHMARVLRY